MVRRRSTVRFRNGAPSCRLKADSDPGTGLFLVTVQQQCAAVASRAELVGELPECFACRRRHDLGVALSRWRSCCVPQDLHGHAGWMSGAARSDPHVVQVPDSDPVDPGFADAPVELREGVQLVRRAVPRVKRQAGLDPAVTGMLTVGVLLLPARLERGHARSGRGSGAPDPSASARPSQELAADPLDLLADAQPRVHPRPGRLPHPSHTDRVPQPIFEARSQRNPNWTLQPRQQ